MEKVLKKNAITQGSIQDIQNWQMAPVLTFRFRFDRP